MRDRMGWLEGWAVLALETPGEKQSSRIGFCGGPLIEQKTLDEWGTALYPVGQ
jgi:hypothetical protein